MKKLYPVIHYFNLSTTQRNLEICIANNCDGVFLINMECEPEELNPTIELVRKIGGDNFFVGVNYLGADLTYIKHNILLNRLVNGIWVDNPGLYSDLIESGVYEINECLKQRKSYDPTFNFFGSIAFKTHRRKSDPATVSKLAKDMGWIGTTSGIATGIAADIEKIVSMKNSIGDYPLAIASGIDPNNVDEFLPYIDYYLVATGISKDFHNFDENKVKILSDKIKKYII